MSADTPGNDILRDVAGGGKPMPSRRQIDQPPVKPLANPSPNEFTVSALKMRPDLTQPRRAVPPSLEWNGDPAHFGAMFDAWITHIATALGRDPNSLFDQYALVVTGEAEMDDVTDEQQTPLERRFLALLDLAASLKLDKQINSVVVIKRPDDLWQIENGERRWLAFMLLTYLLKDEQYLQVRVRVEAEFNRFRQGAENIARSDLNMVSRSRQFALYLMEIVKEHGAARITPYERCSSDRAYYAQVVDQEVPDGKLQKLLNALGVKSKASVAQYRQVLALPDDQWLVADEQDWSRTRIEGWFTAVNHTKIQGKSTRKANDKKKTKTLPIKQKFTAYKSQFERDFKKPEMRGALAQELDDLEQWITEKRAALGGS